MFYVCYVKRSKSFDNFVVLIICRCIVTFIFEFVQLNCYKIPHIYSNLDYTTMASVCGFCNGKGRAAFEEHCRRHIRGIQITIHLSEFSPN